MKRQTLVVMALLWIITGCAVGNKYAYHQVTPELKANTGHSVAVAAQDQRSYVQNGEKQPDFVGLQRGGFGNPFNVSTASGKPLAEDMAAAIVRSLKDKGVKTVSVQVNPTDDMNAVITALNNANAQRLILLSLKHWKSDTYNNVGLAYDLVLQVFDAKGNQLAQKQVSGDDNLGGSAWNPPAHARKALPKAYKEKLEQLLNDPAISSALK